MYKLIKVDENNIRDFMYVNIKAWQESYIGIINQEYLDNLDKDFDDKVSRQINKMKNEDRSLKDRYLLCVDDKPVGIVNFGKSRLEEYPDDGELHAIYLLNVAKKYGYGKVMFDLAVKSLKDQGYKRMLIGCLNGNPSNEFYKHMGAKEIFRKKIKIGNDEYEEIYYLLEI